MKLIRFLLFLAIFVVGLAALRSDDPRVTGAGAMMLVVGIGLGMFAERTRRTNLDLKTTKRAIPTLRHGRNVSAFRLLIWAAIAFAAVYAGLAKRDG